MNCFRLLSVLSVAMDTHLFFSLLGTFFWFDDYVRVGRVVSRGGLDTTLGRKRGRMMTG